MARGGVVAHGERGVRGHPGRPHADRGPVVGSRGVHQEADHREAGGREVRADDQGGPALRTRPVRRRRVGGMVERDGHGLREQGAGHGEARVRQAVAR
jgi:hypothetical protein